MLLVAGCPLSVQALVRLIQTLVRQLAPIRDRARDERGRLRFSLSALSSDQTQCSISPGRAQSVATELSTLSIGRKLDAVRQQSHCLVHCSFALAPLSVLGAQRGRQQHWTGAQVASDAERSKHACERRARSPKPEELKLLRVVHRQSTFFCRQKAGTRVWETLLPRRCFRTDSFGQRLAGYSVRWKQTTHSASQPLRVALRLLIRRHLRAIRILLVVPEGLFPQPARSREKWPGV